LYGDPDGCAQGPRTRLKRHHSYFVGHLQLLHRPGEKKKDLVASPAGVEAILQAMAAHRTAPGVQIPGCRLLKRIARGTCAYFERQPCVIFYGPESDAGVRTLTSVTLALLLVRRLLRPFPHVYSYHLVARCSNSRPPPILPIVPSFPLFIFHDDGLSG